MIIEIIMSTLGADGKTHLAPIGILLPDEVESPGEARELRFKLYEGSVTYKNLQVLGEGVANLTGNVLYFVDAALRESCETHPSAGVRPHRLADTIGFWEFSVSSFDTSRNPALVVAQVLIYEEPGRAPGFCRAHGAVLEAAIAASRRRFLPRQAIEKPWPGWREIVEKTGGRQERQAFEILSEKLVGEGFFLTGEGQM